MSIRERLSAVAARGRNKPHVVGWTPEPEIDDDWTRVRRGNGAQRKGRIYAATRNDHYPVDINHQNRAGHRAYVRVMQTRQVRRNIVGFGKWRRHNESTEPSNAALTSIMPLAPRSERRYEMIETDRASRRARGRRITPVD